MTDKQIKDGIDVSQCECYSVEDNSCNDTLSGSCMKEKCQTFRLLQTIKAKEQECEELKKWKENVANMFDKTYRCKYLNEENAHCSFYNKECIAINQCLYKNQQTLTEIKEIIEQGIKIHDDIIVSKQILQIIDEVE